MEKRLKIALAVLAVALGAATVCLVVKPSDEPVYQGKRLSDWLKAYTPQPPPPAREKADKAVRQIGTNAIPTLLRMLRAKDSSLKFSLMRFAYRHGITAIRPAAFSNQEAVEGFRVLGATGVSAVPSLVEIVDQNISPESQAFAFLALEQIGFSGKEAAPALVRWSTSTNASLRSLATPRLPPLQIFLPFFYSSTERNHG